MLNEPDANPKPVVFAYDVIGRDKTGAGADGKRINLVKLAAAQKQLLWCVLFRVFAEVASVVMFGAGPFGGALYIIASVVLAIVTIVFIVRMAAAYGVNPVMAVLGGIAIVIPCVGLILLLLLNDRVNKTLQRAGAKVGLMGVSAKEMLKLREGYCEECGYELRGLTIPQCPECGKGIDIRPTS